MIENAIYDLLQKEPFFANFILGCQIIYNDPKVKTAACTFKNNKITFIFNTEFISKLTKENKTAVLKHEVMHILLDHVGNRMYGLENRMAKNLAMDCAINQYINGLMEGAVTLESMSELCKKELSPYETWEYYYHQLKDSVENNGEQHDHDAMEGDGSEGESEAQESLKKAIIKDAANKALKASAGKMPDGLSSVISDPVSYTHLRAHET